MKNRKRAVSESDDDLSSDDEPKARHARKKPKHGASHDADEVIEELDTNEEPEEVEDDDDEELVHKEVSYLAALKRIKLTWLVKDESDLEERHQGDIPDTLIYNKRSSYHILKSCYSQLQEGRQKQSTERSLVPSLQVRKILQEISDIMENL